LLFSNKHEVWIKQSFWHLDHFPVRNKDKITYSCTLLSAVKII